MDKTLIILRGLPGSGKTTLADFLLSKISSGKSRECIAVAADDYFTDSNGNYTFNAEKLGAAHVYCRHAVEQAMNSEIPFIIIHNTSTTEKELTPYVELATINGYQLVSLVVENRHNSLNTHKVPEDVLNRMKDRFSIRLI